MLNLSNLLDDLFEALPYKAIVIYNHSGQHFINSRALHFLKASNVDIDSFLRDLHSVRAQENSLPSFFGDVDVKLFYVDSEDCPLTVALLSEKDASVDEESAIALACLDAVTDLNIIACNMSGKIVVYNDASARIDNLKKEQVYGQNMYRLFNTEQETGIRAVLRTGKPVLDYSSSYYIGDREIRCLGSSYPIFSDNRMIGALSLNRTDEAIRSLLMKSINLQKKLIASTTANGSGAKYEFEDIIGSSPQLLETIELAKKASQTNANVLIYGETGTGKELFAQSIHNAGVYRGKPFIAVNCAAIPDSLLESTLFGTVRGSFTGAENMPGLLEQANEGTLFLDEINSMNIALQAKLLRVLQERIYMRVGGNRNLQMKCRIICSTNQLPTSCIESGALRRDLYYRISVINIEIPALRNRTGDIEVLSDYFMRHFSESYGLKNTGISKQLQKYFNHYSWPGNVRQLRHVIESAVLQIHSGENLEIRHLSPSFWELLDEESENHAWQREGDGTDEWCNDVADSFHFDFSAPIGLEAEMNLAKAKIITLALEKNNGNISKTAELLGYDRSTLRYQMKKLGVCTPREQKRD